MKPPLFAPQATGGRVARDGFEYQDAFLLEHIPKFLAQGAFSQVVSEHLGDVELRYFRPGGGTKCVFYEAKGYQLTKTDFWNEVAHFKELHEQSPNEYVQFVLVCEDYVDAYQAMLRKLERYRGPGQSLNEDSEIRTSAREDIVKTIVQFGQSEGMAQFVLERVMFIRYSSANVDAGFGTKLEEFLPKLDLSRSETAAFRSKCRGLVNKSVNGVVTRSEVEAALIECAPSVASAWRATPTVLELTSTAFEIGTVSLDVSAFNGPGRGTLPKEDWTQLQTKLQDVGAFLHATRIRRGVYLTSKHRMSLACLLGYCFSATRNFTLAIEHNGHVYDTSTHDRLPAPFFKASEISPAQLGVEDGIASISFPNSSNADIDANAKRFGLEAGPKIHLVSAGVVSDIGSLNTAVSEAKVALAAYRSRHQLQRIHLFIKTPAVFAMALGHRLNGVGRIQLYDWIDSAYMRGGRDSCKFPQKEP